MDGIVERARALVGRRFRPQGRDPQTGLDCIGLACTSYRVPTSEIPFNYRLRGDHRGQLVNGLRAWFREVAKTRAKAGDLVLLEVAPDQLHVAILTERGFVHADARLRKIVEAPGAPIWPILSVHRRRKRKLNEK